MIRRRQWLLFCERDAPGSVRTHVLRELAPHPAGAGRALAVHLAPGRRSHDEQMDVMGAFADEFPGEGLAFLEDVAVPAWRELGVELY